MILGGDPLIPQVKLQEFLTALKVILGRMETKSFPQLREKVLPMIKGIREASSKDFSDDAFSKHYWSDFKKKNPEIQTIWRSLRRSNAADPVLRDLIDDRRSAVNASKIQNNIIQPEDFPFIEDQHHDESVGSSSQKDEVLSWITDDEDQNEALPAEKVLEQVDIPVEEYDDLSLKILEENNKIYYFGSPNDISFLKQDDGLSKKEGLDFVAEFRKEWAERSQMLKTVPKSVYHCYNY